MFIDHQDVRGLNIMAHKKTQTYVKWRQKRVFNHDINKVVHETPAAVFCIISCNKTNINIIVKATYNII